MAPEVEAEGKTWRFMGLIGKNRKEWVLTHVAGMHQSITSIPLYQTLGLSSIAYIIDQTKLTTVAADKEQIGKLAQLKIDD